MTDSAEVPIQVRDSTIHGSGAFAARNIKAGECIGRYTGRLYAPEEVGERDWDEALTFVFGLADGSVIDGSEGGNATRHINHSCKPNCAAYETEADDGEAWIVIEALRRIPAGQELFIDYCLQVDAETTERFVCHCGAKACRGTLVGSTAPA
jgi:uncharacterized protein